MRHHVTCHMSSRFVHHPSVHHRVQICHVSDRKKDLVKLQVGEYVALSKVETVLKLSNLVDNVCAYADSSKMYPVCLVVPNNKNLVSLARTIGIFVSIEDWQHLCDNQQVEKAVLHELQNYGRKGEFQCTFPVYPISW